MVIEVQSDVPLPAKRLSSRKRRYPLATMGVGEMFFVPRAKTASMTSYVSTQGRKLGRKFATRSAYMKESFEGWKDADPEEPGVVGVCVWRIE
jgi:hypothetical protein